MDTVVDGSDNAQIPTARTATIPTQANVASIIELISIIVLTSFLIRRGTAEQGMMISRLLLQ